jgi:hypothetical protein
MNWLYYFESELSNSPRMICRATIASMMIFAIIFCVLIFIFLCAREDKQ